MVMMEFGRRLYEVVMSFREFNIDGMALSKSDSFIMNRWLVRSRKCCKANYWNIHGASQNSQRRGYVKYRRSKINAQLLFWSVYVLLVMFTPT